MANKLPAYIIRDITFAAGAAGNRVGQASEMTIPVLGKTMEEFRNAGMIKPREVVMGYEATSASFKETAFDPAMVALFGLGAASQLIAYAYARSEDGTTHAIRFEMVAEVKSIDAGDWSVASKSETSFDVAVHSGRLFIDDVEIISFDDFDYRVRGVSQMPGRNAALRIG